jgi:single-strand DNA-binding protein
VLNMAVVIGSLTKPVDIRSLPSGTSVASFDLQVLRTDQSAETVPVTLSETPELVADWAVGEQLLVIGRVRRRFFRAGGSTQSRTEVVAERVLRLQEAENAVAALVGTGRALDVIVADIGRASPG